jgi:hypothetical protein
MGMFDFDHDGNSWDDVAGIAAGVGNVGRDIMFGHGIEGNSVGERVRNTPGHIANTYRSGSRAGNQAVDDVAAWWDNL